jgi:acyl-CoA synthetase (AMP-forming)/AMP-acid ligase II
MVLAGRAAMERETAAGRLVVPDEVVAQIAGRHAIATAAVAGLLRPGSAASSPLLAIDRVGRGVTVAVDGERVRIAIHAAARLGASGEALERAARDGPGPRADLAAVAQRGGGM